MPGFELVVLIFSIVIHEVSHGFTAERLGDPTARLAGRLTLNPLKHIDPIGSVALPLLLFITNSPFVFGWAKPVPYNPEYLKNPRVGGAQIAAAGPASNFLLAAIFALAIRGMIHFDFTQAAPLLEPFQQIVLINLLLAVFNLVPIPPLDGSKVLFALLPVTPGTIALVRGLEQYGFFLLLLFLFLGFGWIAPVIGFLFNLLVVYPYA